jgi:hypothetical protein
MIEAIPARPDGTLEFRFSGKVTANDYETVLVPAIERALADHDRIRLLAQVGPDFEGYTLHAAWDDSRLGLKHWHGFDRVAVVTDVAWLRMATKAFSFALPCPMMTFGLSELDDARRWLAEDLGTIHLRELGGNCLAVQLIGQLDSEAYARTTPDIDAFTARHPRIRLLIDLREFDGWQGLNGLSAHLGLIRDHYRAPERVAVLGHAAWQHLAEKVFGRFVGAETRYFQGADLSNVEAWLKGE